MLNFNIFLKYKNKNKKVKKMSEENQIEELNKEETETQRKIDLLLEFYDHNDQQLQLELEKIDEEFNGLIGMDGNIEELFKRKKIEPEIQKSSTNEQDPDDIKFLKSKRIFLQRIVDEKEFRKKIHDHAPKTEKGYLYTLKLGDPTNQSKKEASIFTGTNFSAYVMVLSRKNIESVNLQSQEREIKQVINAIFFTDNGKTHYCSYFPHAFDSMLGNQNSYYTLFRMQYEGLKDSEKTKGHKYHAGRCYRIIRINKSIQSTLNTSK